MIDWIATHIPPWVWIALIVHLAVLGTVAYLILLERKVASWVQDRIGPNRVGPRGLLQPIADGLKFILKEDYAPSGVDKALFTIAPAVMILVIIVSIAVIPWGGIKGQITRNVPIPAGAVPAEVVATIIPNNHELVCVSIPSEPPRDVLFRKDQADSVDPRFHAPAATSMVVDVSHGWAVQIASVNIGVLFIIAVLSLSVYGVVIGGWASNNKYSFLGGLRATANMISYEIPLGLSLLAIVIMFGTLDLGIIVERQTHYWGHIKGFGIIPAWNVFTQPLAFLMFLICIHAEANRAPFDLAEAEQELVGGYHTEYSSMRFALFFLAEYAGMITTSAVCVALFFGGWHIPWLDQFPATRPQEGSGMVAFSSSLGICLLRAFAFYIKTLLIIFVFMWVRWSLPRFRFDQLMNIAWRAMIPIALAQLMLTAALIYWLHVSKGQTPAYGVSAVQAIWFFAMNIAILLGAMLLSVLIPAPPATNRRVRVAGSRFEPTPLPAAS